MIAPLVGGCDPTDETVDPPTLAPFDASVPAGFVSHRARTGAVKLKAPPTWRETVTSGTVVLNLLTDRPGSSVNVVIVPATPGETLGTTMEHVPGDLKHEFADFRLIKNDLIVVNDLPTGRIEYEASRGGFHGKLMQAFINKGNKSYVLTYTASVEHFDDEERAAEQVLASLVIP